MVIKQKNCFIANLCSILIKHRISPEALFWALVDIDDINYKQYTLDWVSCYLSKLGIYDDSLWTEFQAATLRELQQQFNTQECPHLIVAPINSITYRHDLGNDLYHNTRHVLLIHSNNAKSIFLEDLAIGATGDAFPKTLLNESQLTFPLTYFQFDSKTFIHRTLSIDLQQKASEYANQLINRATQIRTLKRQMLIETIQNNSLDMLTCSNLYEESYYYRAFFMSQQDHPSDVYAHHDQYKQSLSQFKRQFLRMQYCNSANEMRQLQHKANDHIYRLSELDHEFYQTFIRYC